MESIGCDLCGADNPETLFVGSLWMRSLLNDIALRRCRQCGLMYLSPRPNPEEMEAYYPTDYWAYRPAIEDERWDLMRWMRRRKMIQRRQWVERYSISKPGRILDVGCATGAFLREMSQAGWQVAGIEPMTAPAEYARTHLGLEVFQGTLEDAPYAAASFDVITFWDVLEHTHSPKAQLARTAELLRPGGLAVINIPNWHSLDRRLFGQYWSGYDPPRHLYVFTRATMSALLRHSGLTPFAWVSFMPAYYPFIISIDFWLQSVSSRWARRVGRALNFPGVRFLFEPWFTLSNWLNYSSEICVFARKNA